MLFRLLTPVLFILITALSALAQQWLVPPTLHYECIKTFSSNGLAAACRNDKWGYVDTLGREVIACQYEDVAHFDGRFARVKLDRKQEAVIDQTGRVVIKIPEVEEISTRQLNDWGWAWAEKHASQPNVVVDSTGKVILGKHGNYYHVQVSRHLIASDSGYNTSRFLMNKQGEIVYSNKGKEDFSSPFAIFHLAANDQCIVIDSNGNWVKENPFDKCEAAFDGNLLLVKKNGQMGCLRPDGTWALPLVYQNIVCDFSLARWEWAAPCCHCFLKATDSTGTSFLFDCEGRMLHKVPQNGSRTLLPFKTEAGEYFYVFGSLPKQTYAGASWQFYIKGLCDAKGKTLLPPVYKDFSFVPPHYCLYLTDKKQGIFDLSTHKVIFETNATGGGISIGLNSAHNFRYFFVTPLLPQRCVTVGIVEKQAQKTGLMRFDGTWRIKPMAGELYSYDGKLFIHSRNMSGGNVVIRVLDSLGNQLHPADFEYIEPYAGNHLYLAAFWRSPREREEGVPMRFTILDAQGKERIMPTTDKPQISEHDSLIWFCYNNMRAVVDSAGYYRLTMPYAQVYPFSGGRAMVYDGEKYGYINRYGEEVIAPMFDTAHHFVDNKAAAQKEGRWGVIDSTGNWVVQPTLQQEPPAPAPVQFFRHGVSNDLPWAYGDFYEGLMHHKLNVYGCLHANGKMLLKPQLIGVSSVYNSMCSPLSNAPFPSLPNIFAVNYRGRWGIIKF